MVGLFLDIIEIDRGQINKKPTLVMRIGFLYVRNNRFSITS